MITGIEKVAGVIDDLVHSLALANPKPAGLDVPLARTTGRTLGAIPGAAIGGLGGGGLGLLTHYLMANEEKRKFKDYLKSLAGGGLLGAGAGGLGGGYLGGRVLGEAAEINRAAVPQLRLMEALGLSPTRGSE